eukprot:gene9338-19381_t
MSLQLAAQEKDEARIRHKQEVLKRQQERIRNPRNLAMGIDSKFLDSQVSEQRSKEAALKEDARLERLNMLEMERLMEEAALEERNMKDFQKLKLIEEWKKSQSETAEKNVKVHEIYDPSASGTSSCQTFDGEDPGQVDRSKLQKAQMKRWIQEQLAEKAYKQAKEKEDEHLYSQYMDTMGNLLSASQAEEAENRRQMKLEFARANREMADEVIRRKTEERSKKFKNDAEEISATLSLNMMLEDVNSAVVNEHGKIARRDHFKGFTSEQRQKIHNENMQAIQRKKDAERLEKMRDSEVDRQQAIAMRSLEKAVESDNLRKQQERREALEGIRQQMDEQSTRRATNRAERLVGIDAENSMFSKFGRG